MEGKRNAAREFIFLISDRQWHDVYEFHQKFRMAPLFIIELIDFFTDKGVIVKEGRLVKLSESLSNEQVALLNVLQKTTRPNILNTFSPNKNPTAWKHRLTPF
ncbi:hypothetical protein F6V05_29040 [Pseudomonas aeruginosa]|uniref:hypothetical protein n=1 Tax=Pseudomonas aeruginosa TaxID=287 RepID=UPI0011BF1AB9|nr:hypothetical protein [Pseudomonas aeruginosa]EIU7190175.1 hypothetical protein [Pseudomonas aeruginosa]EKU9565754.1 hypothetical protein [Pseudomonas aeruginosa]MDF1652956.1 hypothetical protein [Pseudomonas aeruginosa]HCF4511737.1 hypothetical protein [Pseudomonas aeruginosa]